MARNRSSEPFGVDDGLKFSETGIQEPTKHLKSESTKGQLEEGGLLTGPENTSPITGQHQEKSERSRPKYGHTQGVKGQKSMRINMSFSDENYDFVKRESRRNGMSYSQFINKYLDDARMNYTGPFN